MNVTSIENPIAKIGNANTPAGREEMAAKQAAVEFESLLLTQLTSAMNPSAGEEEEMLFSSTGSDMYRQLFSEQMAKVMANNGGVGIADTILRQLREKNAGTNSKTGALDRAIEAVNAVKQGSAGSASLKDPQAEKTVEVASSTPLQLPLSGRLTSQFGVRTDPINGEHKNHHGIDIAAPNGSAIGAAAAGTVVFAGRRGGYGNTVIIEQPDGRQELYAHAEQLLVSVGDRVTAGQTIATVGSTGRSTGPHLHFEVRENGQPVDPLTTLAKDFAFARR